jgi:hypothetical protein
MAKRKKSHSRRRNPTGAILVNPSRKRSASKRRLSFKSLFGKRNPSKRKHTARRSSAKRRNPVIINRKRGHKRHARRNPVTIGNPRRRKHSVAKRRRNPSRSGGMVRGFIGKIQSFVKRLPLVGSVLSATVGGFGAALGGAVGVLPTDLALPYVSKYIPAWLAPYAYTVGGMAIGGAVKVLPLSFPMKNELAVSIAAAGGAVDMYRYRRGQSNNLGEVGDSEVGDTYALTYSGADGGADGLGNEGTPLSAIEYAGCDMRDADYAGDDLSGDEIAAAELGREAYRRRFMHHRKHPGQVSDGEPGQAGMPGERWGWLIYWIGFDAFQRLSKMPEAQRKKIIRELKHESMLISQKLLANDVDTSVVQAETAGLLVAA